MVLDFVLSISHEENFFTVFDNNDQGTLVRSNVVRRLAHHNKTMVLSNQANMFDMSKVRSFIALEWVVIDTWAPLSSFKFLRVLNIGYYGDIIIDGSLLQVEPLGQLLHLRFLGVNGRRVEKISEEIGALKMLQTLDLLRSRILSLPSSSSLPTQLVCLRIVFDYSVRDAEMFSVRRLTSREELSLQFSVLNKAPRRLVKEPGSLRELRVLDALIRLEDEEEMKRDLLESVRHLHKLQHLNISCHDSQIFDWRWRQGMEFVLPGDLQTLALDDVVLWKLPSCVDPLCHRMLSHMDLCLLYMDEQDLKTLGRLPELRFLGLDLQGASATIRNISDSDACYFPKLRCLRLKSSLVLFVANKGDDVKNCVSFHIWDGKVDHSISDSDVSDAELQADDELSSMFQWGTGRGPVGEKSDDELQLLSVSDDLEPRRPCFQPSTPPVSDEEKKQGSISTREGDGEGAATPRFMPRLQVLYFQVCGQVVREPRYCDNLGLKFLSSLQEISVYIDTPYGFYTSMQVDEVKEALRTAAQVHPNHPTLRIY
jgi:disease resistance protein RPM1